MSGRHIAVVPARGGSKGVPRKNLVLVGGRPLVVHTIEAALRSGVFDAVVVSTEDAEIAAIAHAAGAEVVPRPWSLAEDVTPTEPVMAHALEHTERASGVRFDYVWLLQPTSPLRDAGDIYGAARALKTSGVDAVVAMVEEHVFRWRPVGTASGVTLVEPEYDLSQRPRRQERGAVLRETGAIYAVSRGVWESTGLRAAGRVAAFIMDPTHAVDVDSPRDVAYVEWLMKQSSTDNTPR